jgi:hypothetical protein
VDNSLPDKTLSDLIAYTSYPQLFHISVENLLSPVKNLLRSGLEVSVSNPLTVDGDSPSRKYPPSYPVDIHIVFHRVIHRVWFV